MFISKLDIKIEFNHHFFLKEKKRRRSKFERFEQFITDIKHDIRLWKKAKKLKRDTK